MSVASAELESGSRTGSDRADRPAALQIAGRVAAQAAAQTPVGRVAAVADAAGLPVGRVAVGADAAGLPVGRVAVGAVALIGGAGMLVMMMAVAVLAGTGTGAGGSATGGSGPGVGVSALALREIPPEYLRLYEAAGAKYGLNWAVLAGIGKVECDHGRDPDPSCTKEGAVNSAGAGGPMQFLASTWAQYGVDGEGHSGPPDRWNPADAIYSAANYLRASGAPKDYRQAIYAYNHAWWYVDEVEAWARKYSSPPVSSVAGGILGAGGGVGATGEGGVEGGAGAGAGVEAGTDGEGPTGADRSLAGETETPVKFIPGEVARLDPSDGHVALIPAGVPAVVQAMLVAGDELQELPYGPGGHPDPLGASEEDCSSTVNYVLYRAGVRGLQEIVKDNPLAQDYVGWGDPGPGRWVTIYATDTPTPHVFMTIAGLRLDTSHTGTDEGPNRDEDGPRWRVLPYIPTWAHWSVRHPPGL
jgi:Transglycosylase SLT domain